MRVDSQHSYATRKLTFSRSSCTNAATELIVRDPMNRWTISSVLTSRSDRPRLRCGLGVYCCRGGTEVRHRFWRDWAATERLRNAASPSTAQIYPRIWEFVEQNARRQTLTDGSNPTDLLPLLAQPLEQHHLLILCDSVLCLTQNFLDPVLGR